MKLISIDDLCRKDPATLAQSGWTELHLELRTQQENTPTAVAEFNAALSPRIEKLLEDVQVTIIDENDVFDAWHRHGLKMPTMMMTPLALAMEHSDGTYSIMFNVKGLREQGTTDLEQVVVHELTHISQLKEGRLVMDEKEIHWEGKRYCGQNYVPQTMVGEGTHGVAYMQCLLPWELEAYIAAYKYAVEHNIESTNRQLTFVLACQVAYHRWLDGADLMACDYDYQGQVLSPFGCSRTSTTGRELLRGAFLNDMTTMIERLGLNPNTVARETTQLFLTMDVEKLLRIFLGYGIHTTKATGFFTTFFDSFPEEVFTAEAIRRIKELAAAGK